MGYVYILTNESYRYGWLRRRLLKIGQTNKKPEDRAKELSSTGVPTPFEVAHSLQSDRYREIEKEMHRELKQFRSNKDREFFKYPLKKAIKLLNELNQKISPTEPDPTNEARPVIQAQEVNNIVINPIRVSGNDYQVKEGINGEAYYSAANGFHEATQANGVSVAIRPHITIIIDNEELEIRASHEDLEDQVNTLDSDVEELKISKKEVEQTIKENQKDMAEKQQALSELEAIENLESAILDKVAENDRKKVKLAEMEAKLKKFPADDDTSKHRQLRIYPGFGVFCVLLALALYFFYVSAIDKGFFSSIDLENMDMASYASLNELFDPTAFFRTIQEANFWLLLIPIFPLGLALVIHPFWTSAVKHWETGKRLLAGFSTCMALFFVFLTFVFDAVLALQISKKIHEAKVIMGLATEEWAINPINPLTWNLDIVLVLFCGFFVSVLLSVLFHFTLEMWKEAKTQSTADRDSIITEKTALEAEIKNAENEINRFDKNLQSAKQEMGGSIDAVLIKSKITALKNEIKNLSDQIASERKNVGNIKSDIQQKENSINELRGKKGKRLVDIVKLRAQIDEFLTGWNRFLAAQNGDDAEDVIETAREIAYNAVDTHFQSGGNRWDTQ
ncbi:MAG: GIY-YIG nuclease family protein [Candidatus Poribacteria bacterium]|nr:GIY-YIG nuclease family protein [Candidatus Poribacteria bacterium]